MSDEITRVLNNLAVDEQNLRKAFDMPFLAHRQKEAREIIVALKARNERLEKALIRIGNGFGWQGLVAWEALGIKTKGKTVDEITQEAKALLEEMKK